MNQDHWQKVKGLFEAAVELAPNKRKRFLDKSCGKDNGLRREVENLLDSFENAESFMEQPAAREVAGLILGKEEKLKSGQIIAHYEIINLLGAGGMGEVYLAEDTKLHRRVALKVIHKNLSADNQANQRLLREAQAAATLDHPNICAIHEISEAENCSFIVMQFVEGEMLAEKLGKEKLDIQTSLDLAIQIADALEEAHAHHIIHRDIKPANIIINNKGQAKVLDFGLAKFLKAESEGETAKMLSTPSAIMGTVPYMSPEQLRGGKLDTQTDIFSFGALVYEMLCGQQPFSKGNNAETIASILNDEPSFVEIPPILQPIVQKSLAKNKTERYQTAKDLVVDLKNLQKRLEFEAGLNKFGVSSSDGNLNLQDTKILENPATAKQPEGETLNLQNSIAVLPFANMSNDAENECFCDGLAEELLNALAKIKDLKVAARTSAFSFKNKNVDVSEIGNTLNVKTILEGSVRKSGNRLRISAQLVNASSGFQIWSKRYDGELKDIFDLQDEITLAVIDELKVKFLSEEKAALRNRYDENVEAYQFYLKGRFHYLKLRPAEIQTGISSFQKAIELDSSYALAYVGLAQALQTLPLAAELPANEFFPKAKAAALRSIEIDDRLAEAHGVLGWILFWFDWDWENAENACRRALELDSNSADAHEAFAHLLSNIGRHDESLVEIKRAKDLDPLNLRINALEGQFLLHAGKLDEALAQLQKTFELEPNFWLTYMSTASAYIEKEMFAEAAAEASKARQLSGGSSHTAALVVYALAKSGKLEEAQAVLEEMRQLSNARHVPPYHFALAYHGLNKRDETYARLESALEQRDPKLAFLKVEPKWNNLRSEPRFVDLMRRMNLD